MMKGDVKLTHCLIVAGVLSALCEISLVYAGMQYGRIIDNGNLLGLVCALFHWIPAIVIDVLGLSEPLATVVALLGGAFQFFMLFGVISITFHSVIDVAARSRCAAKAIESHPDYQEFLDEDPQRNYIYYEDLPRQFAEWLNRRNAECASELKTKAH